MEMTASLSQFVKPYSRGQITIPKDYREYLGIDENTWLKISLLNKQILIQPAKETKDQRVIRPKIGLKAYRKVLSRIKGGWFDKKEYKKMRDEIEERLWRNEKALS